MQIRGTLQDDHTDKNDFPDVWNETPANKRHRAIKDITDYLLVDDFYSELKKRIRYLSEGWKKEKSDLSKANALLKHNEAILAAAEDVLNKVDLNKYR